MYPYKNPSLSPEERAKDLLSRMTIREKIAQMTLITGIEKDFDGAKFDERFPDGLGATYDTIDFSPADINRMQKHMLENTRLGIPMFMMSESLHGFFHNGSTIYPQAIGLGATFDEDLLYNAAKHMGEEAHAFGIHETFAPNIDLSRDPRWGRAEENYGEDPYLTARLGVAYIKGLQENNVVSCPKHYMAHGSPESGINISPVHAGEREVRETMYKTFAAAFIKGKAMSVMPAYSELDGVPMHASRFYCTDVLRGEFGFEGWSVSDWSAIYMLHGTHHVAADPLTAGKMALHAGIDMEAPGPYGYGKEFIEAAEKGEVNMEELDLAVYRILLGKFRLGLFENPYAEADAEKVLGKPEAKALALKAALESCVLMKNDGILPLNAKSGKKIALVGPGAAITQLGDYVYPTELDRAVTILDSMKKRIGDNLIYAQGSSIAWASDEMLAEAEKACAEADEVVMVLSSNSGYYHIYAGDDNKGHYKRAAVTCGEGFDVASLEFPEGQMKLMEKVFACGKPVILLCMTGRPQQLTEAEPKCNAIMQVWYPGEVGGEAVAQLLFGEANPSGRLPISFPRSVGHIPCFYNYKASKANTYHEPGSYDKPGRDYVFDQNNALYSFGHGMSYTTFEYSDIKVEQQGATDFTATVTVKNTGAMAGDEVVLMFLEDLYCRITPFVSKLRGFKRITLAPGEEKTVTFTIDFNDLSFINEQMKPEVEAGTFEVRIGDKKAQFEVKDDTRSSNEVKAVFRHIVQ